MTHKEMQYIQMIAKEGNLSKAAKALYMTQPSLSHALKKIETDLNVKLFKRTNRGLVLTFEGERYLTVTSTILKLYSDFENEMRDINDLLIGKLNIGVTLYIGSNVLPDLIKAFKDIAPNIDISFIELTSEELEDLLRQGSIDFALMHKIIREESLSADGVDYRKIIENEFVIVTEKKHKLKEMAEKREGSKEPYLDPKHLDNMPFIMGTKFMRSRKVSDSIIKQAKINVTSTMETRNFRTARNLVARGLGVSILPKVYLGNPKEIDDVSVYRIDEKYSPHWEICLATPSNGYLSKASSAFIKLIGDYYNVGNIIE